jgi:hypothetical protein
MPAITIEQPLLPGMPSESKVASAVRETVHEVEAWKKDSSEQGGLMTKSLAADVLNVTPQRVSEMVREGRFRVFKHFEREWLSTEEVKGYFATERKAGRPWKKPGMGKLLRTALKDCAEAVR